MYCNWLSKGDGCEQERFGFLAVIALRQKERKGGRGVGREISTSCGVVGCIDIGERRKSYIGEKKK